MIITTTVKLKGESRPCEHLALVFPCPMGTEDLIAYRNAMTEAVKAILTSGDYDGYLSSECFYLLQMAEFISDSLDEEAEKTSDMIRKLNKEIENLNLMAEFFYDSPDGEAEKTSDMIDMIRKLNKEIETMRKEVAV